MTCLFAPSLTLYPLSVTSWAASSLNSGLKEDLFFSVIFPPINEGVILSRHLMAKFAHPLEKVKLEKDTIYGEM